MTRRIDALILLCLALPGWAPGRAWAARGTPPHPSGIVIHLFGDSAKAQVQPDRPSGITVTKKGTTPVSLGFAKALAKMLNDAGTPSGLTGRQAALPPQSIIPTERHPGQ